MNEKYLSLGNIIAFAMIFPGVALVGLAIVIRPELGKSNAVTLSFAAFVVGFVANALGHATGILYRKLRSQYVGVPFVTIYLRSYDLSSERATHLRKDGEFWFSIHCMYWNTASALVPLTIYFLPDFVANGTVWYVPLILGCAGLLFYLGAQLLDSLVALGNHAVPVAISAQETPTADAELAWLKPDHIASLIDLLSASGVSDNVYHEKTVPEWRQAISKWIDDPRSYLIVNVKNSRVIGFCRFQRWKHAKKEHVAWIGPWAVLPSCQRQGVGRKLLVETLHQCRNAGISRLEIAVPCDAKDIVNFLQSLGFVQEGIQRNALSNLDGSLRDVVMLAAFPLNHTDPASRT